MPYIVLILFISFLGCKGKVENNQNQIIDENTKINIPESLFEYKDQILKRLNIQLSWQSMDDSDPEAFNIQKEDVVIGSIVKLDALEKKGFKSIDNDKFKNKVKDIFSINLESPEQCRFLHDDGEYIVYVMPKYITETDEAREGGIGDFQRGNYYFFRDKNFMTFRVPLMIGSIEEKDNDLSEIVAWDDEYYRNKFLFNDDQSSFTWLSINDMDFLESLIRVFGYDKNEKLNKKVLAAINKKYDNNSGNDYEQLANLFAGRSCNGELQIRANLINTVVDDTTLENNTLLTMLEDYVTAIIDNEKTASNENVQGDFSQSERVKIFTMIGCEIEKVYLKLDINQGSQNWSETSVLYNKLVGNTGLLDIIKKEQYYESPEIERIIQEVISRIEAVSEN